MTEVVPTFGIKKGETLKRQIINFLEKNAEEYGKQENCEVYIFANGKKHTMFDDYQLFFAYINIRYLDKLENLLKKHHHDYCLLCNSMGG